MTSPTQQLAPALDIDARLTEIERSVDLLLNVTPVNAAEAWADFERSDFGTVPTLRLRPLEFEPDLVRRDLYKLEIEDVSRPCAAYTLPGEARRDCKTDHNLGGSRHFTIRLRVAAALRRDRPATRIRR